MALQCFEMYHVSGSFRNCIKGSFSSKSSFCIIYKASCINNLRHVSMQQKNIKENHHSVSKKATWCIIAKMHHFFIKIFSKKIPIVFCGQARPTAARHTPIHLYGRRDTLKMYQSWICVSDITFMYMYLLQRSLNVSKSCITYRSFHVLFQRCIKIVSVFYINVSINTMVTFQSSHECIKQCINSCIMHKSLYRQIDIWKRRNNINTQLSL